MRAQYDFSGWEINTNVQELVNRGVNVVEPIGGPASFYTDWNAPSNFNGQQSRYMWECVINNRLPQALRANGFQGKNGKYAIMGVSMGGNAALVLASKRRDLYYAAGSLSGYNFLSAPGMHTMIRLAMLDVAPQPWNVDAMWGPPWDGRWYDNDPSLRINRMQGLKLFVGSGNGLFGKYNALPNVFDDLFKVRRWSSSRSPSQGLRRTRLHQRPADHELLRQRHPRLGLLAGHGLERYSRGFFN